ncbi:MAG: hypothetical protein ACLP9L_33915 [Thermoguttaceae bacterium]
MKPTMFIVPLILFASGVCAQEDKHNQECRSTIIAKFKSLPDDKLKQSFERLLSVPEFRDDPSYEPCLNEIVRRGGKTWEAFLSAKLETVNKKQIKLGEDLDDTVPGSQYNLELLTALRRVQRKPNPLAIELDARGPLEATSLSLPRLKVKIKNVDCDKTTAGFRDSGDYRSGRQARWRIVARDRNGRELPTRKWPPPQGGNVIREEIGGQYVEGVLEFGKSWGTVLDAANFIKIPKPGTYSLEVLYHDTKTIAEESDVDGLIFFRSKPIVLVVRPLVIELTTQERKQAAELVSALNGAQRLKIVFGAYARSAQKFIPPNTPEGRLLNMGVTATPALIESLKDESLSDNKRAWIFSLLFSITGENDPRDFSAVGAYEYLNTGWSIWGGFSGEGQSGGMAMPQEGFSSDREIDRTAQDKLIGEWKRWLKRVDVREIRTVNQAKPAPKNESRAK